MTSLHVGFERIITYLRVLCFTIFAVNSSIAFHPLTFSYNDPFSGLLLSSHHHYTSHYQFDFFFFASLLLSFSHWAPSSPWLMGFFVHVAFHTWGHGFFIIGYLGLVSLHFYYLITLTYVTSRVLRPPWGHGIRCRPRHPYLDGCLRFGWYLDDIMLLLQGDAALMFGFILVVGLDDWDCMFDDWWFGVAWFFLIYHPFNAILGHIPFRMRFTDIHGVAYLSPLTRYTPRRWPVCYLIIISQWSPSWSIQSDSHFLAFRCHHAPHVGYVSFDTWV